APSYRSSTPHPIPPHVGGRECFCTIGSALSSTPPPILPHVGGRKRCCTFGSALHCFTFTAVPVPSFRGTIRSAVRSRHSSSRPFGQRTESRSTRAAPARPKWTRRSFWDA